MKKMYLFAILCCVTAITAVKIEKKMGTQSCEGEHADCQAEVGKEHDESAHTTAIASCAGQGAHCRARAN